ncbi:MAG: sterol desaturase family protein [Planctomycetota bacterium]
MAVLALTCAIGAMLMVAERVWPGRGLPTAKGWYLRAVLLNVVQLGIVVLGGVTWSVWLRGPSLLHLDGGMPAPAQGFVCWFVGTFIFYWWHRARHEVPLLWRTLHQIHHSPARIEVLTSFYKHPLEISINSVMSTAIVFPLMGSGIEAAPWYSFFAAFGEFFYHMNIRTPRWAGWFLQRPEQHSIHHQRSRHRGNYGDITWWDRMFGTFQEAEAFVPACGYARNREQRLAEMLAFQDVHRRGP